MDTNNLKVTIEGVEVFPVFESFEPVISPVEFAVFSIDPLNFEEVNKNKLVYSLAFALQHIYLLAKKYKDRKKLNTLYETFKALHSLLEDEGVSVTTQAIKYFFRLTKGDD